MYILGKAPTTPEGSTLTPGLENLKHILEAVDSPTEWETNLLKELTTLDAALKKAKDEGRGIDLGHHTFFVGPPPGVCSICGR